jgi:hypothetical protein
MKSINEASIIISELTGRNPNVFYETGITTNSWYLITQNIEDVPSTCVIFDVLFGEYTREEFNLLETNLTNTINNIRTRLN